LDKTDEDINYEDAGFELYFRDEERTTFGVLRFEKRKDNPFRDYKTMINKIMNDKTFRNSLINPNTKSIWNKNWK